jgi:hypothetical protein
MNMDGRNHVFKEIRFAVSLCSIHEEIVKSSRESGRFWKTGASHAVSYRERCTDKCQRIRYFTLDVPIGVQRSNRTYLMSEHSSEVPHVSMAFGASILWAVFAEQSKPSARVGDVAAIARFTTQGNATDKIRHRLQSPI